MINYVINFILSSLENDDMKSSKRCVRLLSLIFILKLGISYEIFVQNEIVSEPNISTPSVAAMSLIISPAIS